jgi:hypothetical protein
MFRKTLATLLALPLITLGMNAANAAAQPYTQNFDAMATYTGVDFDGGVGTLVSDQPAGEGFTSGKALKVETKIKAWAGTKIEMPTSFSFISNANKTGSISVYSPDDQSRCFVMKLEGPGVGIEKRLNVQPGWQTLNFNYAAEYNATKNYNVVALMPDFFGVGCNMVWNADNKPLTTWYVDNISFPGARSGDEVIVPEERSTPSTLVNFEANDTSGYENIDFNGAVSSVVTDAPAEGSIGSTKALKVTTTGGTAGTLLVTKTRAASLISASSFVVKVNIHSPVSGKIIMIKLESIDHPSQVVEVRQTSVAGWKTYSFNFEVGGNLTQDYPKAIVFFDFLGTGGDNPWYLDDLAFNGAVGASLPGGGGGNNGGGNNGGGNSGAGEPTPTLLTYEGSDSLGALNASEATGEKPQGVFGGATAAIVAAPAGGLGGSVLGITKSGAPWAGLNALVSSDGSFRYSNEANKFVTFNYYSPKGGSPVAIQLFSPGSETFALEMIQNANAGWNNISFDLSTAPNWSALVKYNKLVIFPDFQVEADNQVYYVDNVAVNGAVTPQIDITDPVDPVDPEPVVVKPAVKTAATVSTSTPRVGVTLRATKGTWTGTSPMTYKYTWYRCNVVGKTALKAKPASSAKCSTISGRTASSYKLTRTDKGKFIRVMVTATNSKGSAMTLSKTTTKKVG